MIVHLECSAHRIFSNVASEGASQRTWLFNDQHIDLKKHSSDPLALQLDECLHMCRDQKKNTPSFYPKKVCSIQQAAQVLKLIQKAELNRC